MFFLITIVWWGFFRVLFFVSFFSWVFFRVFFLVLLLVLLLLLLKMYAHIAINKSMLKCAF